MSKFPWSCICELCYDRLYDTPVLPKTWLLIYQSTICPACQKQVEADHQGVYTDVRCGCYATIPDPRAINAS